MSPISHSWSHLVRVLLLTAVGFSSLVRAADPAASLTSCMVGRRMANSDISTPFDPEYMLSLAQSLVQDPPQNSLPILIARPRSTVQVQSAIRCAVESDVTFCARAGGHSWAASSVCPGLIIDLVHITNYAVSSMGGNAMPTLTIGAGKTIGETMYQLYSTTGCIIPIGTCPSVGAGGYIQGGGMGTLTGSLGLLADYVTRITLVTPAGEIRVASPLKNQGLFWAMRGGGGGYLGVVTQYEMNVVNATNTYDNNVYFSYRWTLDHSAEALHQWTTSTQDGDNGDTYIRMIARVTRQGSLVQMMGVCWKAVAVSECVHRLNSTALWSVPGRSMVVLEKSTRQGAIEAMKFFTADGAYGTARPSDPSNTEDVFSARYTVKAYLSDKSWSAGTWSETAVASNGSYFQGLLDLLETQRSTADLRSISVEFYPMGRGAMQRDTTLSAFPHRDAAAVVAVFYNGGEREQRKAVKRAVQAYLAPFRKGSYINYLDLDLEDYAKEYWGSALSRMLRLKRRFDPDYRQWHSMPLKVV